MAKQSHIKRLKQGIGIWNEWWKEHPKVRADLSKADLQGAHLAGADLLKATFIEADLVKADLSGACLNKANLSKADLSGANLSHANFTEANLSKADLSRIDPTEADFLNANLAEADLTEVDLRRCQGKTLYAFLADANLFRANLSGLRLEGVWLKEANLTRAKLSGVNLTEAILTGADLSKANLIGANLTNAFLCYANLSEADLSRAILVGADLTEAILINADLPGANLSGAHLFGADLSGADLTETNLIEARLHNAVLTDATLTKADLSKAFLIEADLPGANLIQATLVETNVTNATLTDCKVYGISVWNLKGDLKEQHNLLITEEDAPVITVDNLAVAQFIYLLIHYPELGTAIDTITSKVVLILGRFSDERKAVLDAIRDELRNYDLVPVMFDFARPDAQDYMGPVLTIGNMARFVIADFTDAKMVIQEAPTVVENCNKLLVPLLQEEWQEPLTLRQLRYAKRDFVLDTCTYQDIESLLVSLRENIIAPANIRAEELAERRREVFGPVDEEVKKLKEEKK
ncbi:MAG: pentapeptide repeat-containing protein [Halobacteriota archaeon]